jgi:transposase
MPKTLYIGIDISSEDNIAQFMDADGATFRRSLRFPNTQTGLDELVETTSRLVAEHDIDHIHIGMEATGLYWWHLRESLATAPEFESLEVSIYVINPSLIRGFKKAYTTLPKTDAVDAWVIADRLRFGRLKPITEDDLRYQPLARLTRFRYTMTRSLTRDKNRACQLLFLKCSEYRKAAGRRTFGKASMALLTELSAGEIADKPLEELLGIILSNTNNRLADPEEFAEEIKRAAKNSYRLNPKMQNSVDVALAMTCENIRFFEGQCKKLDKVISRELKAIPQTLTSVLGIGDTLAAGIIAEVGDISRFHHEKALAKFAGLTWHRHQSGSFDAEETSLTKAGNHYLRYYLVEAANSLRVHNPEYEAFYAKKYQEVPKHRHKRALVLTARKLVRLVYALLSTGQIYQGRRTS